MHSEQHWRTTIRVFVLRGCILQGSWKTRRHHTFRVGHVSWCGAVLADPCRPNKSGSGIWFFLEGSFGAIYNKNTLKFNGLPPEKWWLEDEFPFWDGLILGANCQISGVHLNLNLPLLFGVVFCLCVMHPDPGEILPQLHRKKLQRR